MPFMNAGSLYRWGGPRYRDRLRHQRRAVHATRRCRRRRAWCRTAPSGRACRGSSARSPADRASAGTSAWLYSPGTALRLPTHGPLRRDQLLDRRGLAAEVHDDEVVHLVTRVEPFGRGRGGRAGRQRPMSPASAARTYVVDGRLMPASSRVVVGGRPPKRVSAPSSRGAGMRLAPWSVMQEASRSPAADRLAAALARGSRPLTDRGPWSRRSVIAVGLPVVSSAFSPPGSRGAGHCRMPESAVRPRPHHRGVPEHAVSCLSGGRATPSGVESRRTCSSSAGAGLARPRQVSLARVLRRSRIRCRPRASGVTTALPRGASRPAATACDHSPRRRRSQWHS